MDILWLCRADGRDSPAVGGQQEITAVERRRAVGRPLCDHVSRAARREVDAQQHAIGPVGDKGNLAARQCCGRHDGHVGAERGQFCNRLARGRAS